MKLAANDLAAVELKDEVTVDTERISGHRRSCGGQVFLPCLRSRPKPSNPALRTSSLRSIRLVVK